ncbi:type III pantothenate kinase [Candidatus Gastranaerophilales bacterium]|nr:MAG: type III pantothenate kinase [Candidatus Gastranaerophilales bacterium]
MLLTADIGNTSITLGLFEDDALVEEFRLASDKDLPLEEYEVLLKSLFKDFKIDGCMISSVVEELNEKFKEAVKNVFKFEPLFLSTKINTGIKIALDHPEEAGADRIANAAGAYVLYSKPVIVVDFGTATSFDIVNKEGEFIGGVIAPGLNLQLKTLNKFTSKLPRIDAAISNNAIGSNTTDAILSGVIRGSACMIDGLVEQCEKELGEKAVLVATGGYSGLISKYLKRQFDYINPTLTLEGLRYLYQLNRLPAMAK